MRWWVAGLAGILLVLSSAACNSGDDFAGNTLTEQADSVRDLLSAAAWGELSHYVHAERGVLFSAYTYVEPAENVTLAREEVALIASDTTQRLWGHQDGSGFPINTTAPEFIDEYIIDQNFDVAERGQPNEIIRTGNTINNVPDAFIDSSVSSRDEIGFVEYHLEGSEEYGGMDWASLRLVFQLERDSWYLIGIVRDRWTI